jgi:hypothetical protein
MKLKTKIGKSEIHGKGLMAGKDLKPGENLGVSHVDNWPTKDIGENYNHSDNPNAMSKNVGNKKIVVPIKKLKKGDEITVDYRTNPELEQPEGFKSGGSLYKMMDYQNGGPENSSSTPVRPVSNKPKPLEIADPKEYKYRKSMYDDSLSLFNAYQFQKKNINPTPILREYVEDYNTTTKKYFNGKRPTLTVDQIKKTRDTNFNKNLPKFSHNEYLKTKKDPSGGFDPMDKASGDYKIYDHNKKLNFNYPVSLGKHSSPDLWHSKINPSGSYFDGVAYSPKYKKPIQPVQFVEKQTETSENTIKEGLNTEVKTISPEEQAPVSNTTPESKTTTKYPIQQAYRAQTIMEPDTAMPGKYKVKEIRQVPYQATSGDSESDWKDVHAPIMLWVNDKGEEVEYDPRKGQDSVNHTQNNASQTEVQNEKAKAERRSQFFDPSDPNRPSFNKGGSIYGMMEYPDGGPGSMTPPAMSLGMTDSAAGKTMLNPFYREQLKIYNDWPTSSNFGSTTAKVLEGRELDNWYSEAVKNQPDLIKEGGLYAGNFKPSRVYLDETGISAYPMFNKPSRYIPAPEPTPPPAPVPVKRPGMYLSANTAQPMPDRGSPGQVDRQYSQYLEEFANSPEQVAARQSTQANMSSNTELLQTMTEEQKAEARKKKMTPTEFLSTQNKSDSVQSSGSIANPVSTENTSPFFDPNDPKRPSFNKGGSLYRMMKY